MPVDNCFEKFEEDLYRGKVDIPDTMPHPRSDAEKYELFQTTPAFQSFEEQFPHYRASIPVAHFHSGNIVDDIALHGKLHFTEFIADVAINPLIDILEDLMEGHALLQVQAALEDKNLPHIVKRLKRESEVQTLKPAKSRKELLVESVRTASYVAFLSQKKRSKQDLDERLEHIISTASALQRSSSGTDGAQIPRELVKTCTELLKKGPANTVDAKRQFLIEIANRQSPKYASAFLGGALTFQEIATIDESRALNSNIEKISPTTTQNES